MPPWNDRNTNESRWTARIACWTMVLVTLSTGCHPGKTTEETPTDSASDVGASSDATNDTASDMNGRAAAVVFDRMIAAYQAADAYQDRASVTLRTKRPEGAQIDTIKMSVAFRRPNRLQWDREGVTILSDGDKVYGKPEGWGGQVVVVPAPKRIEVPVFYNIKSLAPLLQPGIDGYSIQLDLLTAHPSLKDLRKTLSSAHLVEPESIDGRLCDRLVFVTAEGALTFWIDQTDHLLRRVEYPTGGLSREMAKQGVTDVRMTANFTDASWEVAADDERLTWSASEGDILVRHLVQPPNPQVGKPDSPADDKRGKSPEDDFRDRLQFARIDAVEQVVEIPRAKLADASQPDHFKLTKLWENHDVKSPGDLEVVVADDANPHLLVLDGDREVVELTADGKLVARHAPSLPVDARVTFLRTATDGDGKRSYILGGRMQPHCYVVDDAWKVARPYPEADTARIYEVLPADLNGDGADDLCVGYLGETGVHGVTLAGRRLWRNRSIGNVVGLAATRPDAEGHRRLLCAHAFGTLVAIDQEGREQLMTRLPNRSITHVATLPDPIDPKPHAGAEEREAAPAAPIAVLTLDHQGGRSIVGLNELGRPVWRRALPRGEHERPVEMLSRGRLLGDSTDFWFVAAADGSIHMISSDGKTADRFATGERLSGIVTLQKDGKGILIVATDRGITAYAVDR